MIYVTSDLHLGFNNAVKYRPFADVAEMDQSLVNNWNSCVSDSDEVYVLGDLCQTADWDSAYDYLKQLKGHKFLIKGNHDRFIKDPQFIKHYFELITDYHEIKFQQKYFVLCHYPLWDWIHKFRGSIHLFGHIHANDSAILQEFFGKCYHVGVDSNDFRPISLEDIVQRIEHVNRTGLLDEVYQDVKANVWNQDSMLNAEMRS